MSWGNFFNAVSKAVAVISAPRKPKSYPLMTMDMIGSNGQPITTAQAIKLFKLFMLRSGYLQKNEITEHAEYFAEEIRSQTDALAEDLAAARAALKTCSEEDKISCQDAVESARFDLADFKADKRQFLIKYVNQQTQG